MAPFRVMVRGWFRRGHLEHTSHGLAIVSLAGVVATGLTAWWAASSPTFVDPAGLAIWRSLIIAAYWAAGVITWWRRPESRLGQVILCLTLLYVAQAAVGSPEALVYTLGMLVWAGSITYTAYVFLCFPKGQLESALDRWFVRGYWLTTTVVWGLIVALAPTLPPGGSFVNCGTRCPPNGLQVFDGSSSLAAALTTTFHVQFAIALIGLAVLVVSKARSSSRIRRRAMTPLAVAMTADIAEFVVALFVLPAYAGAAGVLKLADGVVTLAVPAAILIGQITADRLAATTTSRIALGTSGTPMNLAAIETMIGDALGDQTVRLALWDPHRSAYVDVSGAPTELPRPDATRRVTEVTREGQPVAALLHDPALDADDHLLAGLTATALMLLQNVRVVHDLRASRARLLSAAERERLQLEGELHDGALQRLVAIQAYLGLARELAERDDVLAQIDRAATHADAAMAELRALSHGVRPNALRDFGLAAALRDLALLSPVDISLVDSGTGRYSPEIEAGLYFFTRDVIRNAAEHAGPEAKIVVTLTGRDHEVEVEIRGERTGMRLERDHEHRGITDMRDRIESLGGVVRVHTVARAGIALRAVIPVRSATRDHDAASPGEDDEASAMS